MNLPNKLTVLRLLLVPLFIVLCLLPNAYFKQEYALLYTTLSLKDIVATVIFVVASLTDYLDGQLARKNKMITTFGKFVDPIADKLLVNSALIILTYEHRMSIICLIVMILRDTVVDGIRFACASRNVVLAASLYGKAKTATQMTAIILLLLNNPIFEMMHIPFSTIMIVIATIISALSGIDYFIKNKQYIMETM